MVNIEVPFGEKRIAAALPDGAAVLTMPKTTALPRPEQAVAQGLAAPIGTPPLAVLATQKADAAKKAGRPPRACVVVSDNTRPVPYRGRQGILLPVLDTVLRAGYAPRDVCVLIATGTHRPMAREEIERMVGPEALALGVRFENHNGMDENALVFLGQTKRGSRISVNRAYVDADLKILTGLVESHFMAGVSGGRKSICPGIMGKEGTMVFHGPQLMSHPDARDLVLAGNPVHEESLEAAKMAGADFIVNVTLDRSFAMTGVFCGDLEQAHAAAAQKLRGEVAIPVEEPYDLVVTHGGYVAKNHYQAAKCGVAALGALKPCGSMVMVADNNDAQPVGLPGYCEVLAKLKERGPRAFNELLVSPGWAFQFDQWQVQKWAEVLAKVGPAGLVYYAPQVPPQAFSGIPGIDGRTFLTKEEEAPETAVPRVIERAVAWYLEKAGYHPRDVAAGRYRVAFLADGPYGIPIPGFTPRCAPASP